MAAPITTTTTATNTGQMESEHAGQVQAMPPSFVVPRSGNLLLVA
ncbi:hypothetical protein SAMN05877831_1225 [Rhodobacter maris]|uniref:Uncharacterized protein n=1 Tax=Rhodobacter maris TaxID=446682 RepID=A0A285TGQ1_9RHOB|nr:hypothetical protein SAMN05877831_1225 [Rhodobacter maris]